ncbi:S1 RNA-binding domain-containing protein 1-like [Rhopilema esculentum]|uniref:S1 RNA-binding domain-containing protein 1-like n=1 Tax=Rhopilema esculentum TaxID=499914 RepID=UPI0031D97654
MANSWNDIANIIAEDLHAIEPANIREAIKLIENDNTIPFIARYRRKQTGGMDASQLRELKISYDTLRAVKNKVLKIIDKDKAIIPAAIKESLFHARTIEEVNDLYAPFKKGGKGTLAERARKNGLESPAKQVLEAPNNFLNLNKYVKANTDGLQTAAEVQAGIQHIIADMISKDEELNRMVNTTLDGEVSMETKTTDGKKKADKEKKFVNYYDFCINIKRIKSHQILAINRGEEQKVLMTKLFMSQNARRNILVWLKTKWVPNSAIGTNRSILTAAVEDAFKRLIEKKFLKRIRVRLTALAEREAADIFSNNLQKLLLAPPVRGKNVLGVDPGFKHGCKIVALDRHGQMLDTAVIFPFGGLAKQAEPSLAELVKKHLCDVIAIGNGTARHETENFIANMIKRGLFKPVEVSYCIVNEAGASVWSVTKEAESEFPNLDPNLRSAVSIGRRLQDPLLELVKIEPKHIGVGMYQHDVSESLLKGALEGVLEDCVSFVGVDLNACSAAMLRRIAGLGSKKADAVIEWRNKNGPFINRKQLLLVKGLGQKCFEQCAGFVRVAARLNDNEAPSCKVKSLRATGMKRKSEFNTKLSSKKRKLEGETYLPEPLDQTMIHPESYSVAYKLLQEIEADANLISTKRLTELLEKTSKTRFDGLVQRLNTDEETLGLIVKALKQPLGYDLRSELEQPLFKKELRTIDDLAIGQLVTGVVRNMTSFGAFVDIGLDKDALIHRSNLAGCNDLGPGDKCECFVINVDKSRQRIGLKFKSRKNNVTMLR